MTVEFVVAKHEEDTSWTDALAAHFDVTIYDKGRGGSLPNVGREAHTFVHHIVTRYESLAAGPPLGSHVSKQYRDDIADRMLRHPYDKTEPFFNAHDCYLHRDHPCQQTHALLFCSPYPQTISFSDGAQWIVQRRHITMRPKAFYEKHLAHVRRHPRRVAHGNHVAVPVRSRRRTQSRILYIGTEKDAEPGGTLPPHSIATSASCAARGFSTASAIASRFRSFPAFCAASTACCWQHP